MVWDVYGCGEGCEVDLWQLEVDGFGVGKLLVMFDYVQGVVVEYDVEYWQVEFGCDCDFLVVYQIVVVIGQVDDGVVVVGQCDVDS